jgi:hypothetical protein
MCRWDHDQWKRHHAFNAAGERFELELCLRPSCGRLTISAAPTGRRVDSFE